MPLEAKKGCCEEASFQPPIPGVYFPCNEPAVCRVYHENGNVTYRMCEACADHNVKNRGGKRLPLEQENNDVR